MLHSEAQLNHASPLYFGGQTIVPVINLKANTTVTGTSDDHWVVQ